MCLFCEDLCRDQGCIVPGLNFFSVFPRSVCNLLQMHGLVQLLLCAVLRFTSQFLARMRGVEFPALRAFLLSMLPFLQGVGDVLFRSSFRLVSTTNQSEVSYRREPSLFMLSCAERSSDTVRAPSREQKELQERDWTVGIPEEEVRVEDAVHIRAGIRSMPPICPFPEKNSVCVWKMLHIYALGCEVCRVSVLVPGEGNNAGYAVH